MRFVALLRGINVGRAKRVAMADLRSLMADLGYEDVRTHLNSGNVVFDGEAADPDELSRVIEERTGVSSRVTVLTGDELRAIVDADPLGDVATDPSRYLVAVLSDPADAAGLEGLTSDERFALGPRAAYLWCPDGQMSSPLPQAVEELIGDRVTTRNWRTMTKLVSMVLER